jgi:methylthioribulose-1-phosphate dehydratase
VWNAELGRYYNFDEEIIVPIIENTCFESELEGSLHAAMLKYPSTSAVLVRRHGIYVWGTSWQQTKAMYKYSSYIWPDKFFVFQL